MSPPCVAAETFSARSKFFKVLVLSQISIPITLNSPVLKGVHFTIRHKCESDVPSLRRGEVPVQIEFGLPKTIRAELPRSSVTMLKAKPQWGRPPKDPDDIPSIPGVDSIFDPPLGKQRVGIEGYRIRTAGASYYNRGIRAGARRADCGRRGYSYEVGWTMKRG